MRTKPILAGALAACLLLALAPPPAIAQPTVQPVAKAEQPATFPFQGVERHYFLHHGAHATGPVPLVLALHGLGDSAAGMHSSWTMDAVADREGFNVVYPEMLTDHWSYSPTRPVTLPGGGLVDDIGFLAALTGKLAADHLVDLDRVYVTGPSNGGLMSWTLACAAADRYAAVAPIVSGMIDHQLAACHPSRAVPLMVIAGTDDITQFYDGGLGDNFRLLSIPETLAFWVALRGCQSETLTTLPAHVATDPTAAMLVEWAPCRDPSPIRYFRIEGGGHYLPTFQPLAPGEFAAHAGRSQTIESAEELWKFFRDQRLPK